MGYLSPQTGYHQSTDTTPLRHTNRRVSSKRKVSNWWEWNTYSDFHSPFCTIKLLSCSPTRTWDIFAHTHDNIKPLPPLLIWHSNRRKTANRKVSFWRQYINYSDCHSPVFQLNIFFVPETVTWYILAHSQHITSPPAPLCTPSISEAVSQKTKWL